MGMPAYVGNANPRNGQITLATNVFEDDDHVGWMHSSQRGCWIWRRPRRPSQNFTRRETTSSTAWRKSTDHGTTKCSSDHLAELAGISICQWHPSTTGGKSANPTEHAEAKWLRAHTFHS